MKTIDYELQQWQPKRPSWVPGSKNFIPGHWKNIFVFKSLPKAIKSRRDFNRHNFISRLNQPWRIVKVTRETVR